MAATSLAPVGESSLLNLLKRAHAHPNLPEELHGLTFPELVGNLDETREALERHRELDVALFDELRSIYFPTHRLLALLNQGERSLFLARKGELSLLGSYSASFGTHPIFEDSEPIEPGILTRILPQLSLTGEVWAEECSADFLDFITQSGLEKALSELGSDISGADLGSYTLLHIAVRHGDRALVEKLIAQGSDPTLPTDQGETVLHLAADYGDERLFLSLLRAISAFEENSPLFSSRPKNRVNDGTLRMECLSAKKWLHLGDSDGKIPLHRAVWGAEKSKLIELLIEVGTNVNRLSNDGHTALHWAAKHNHLESARLLLAAEAQVDVLNQNGDTPLDLALRSHSQGVIRLLLSTLCEEALLDQLYALECESSEALQRGEYCLASAALGKALLITEKESLLHILERQLDRIPHLFLNECATLPHQTRSHRNELLAIRNSAMLSLQEGRPPQEIQRIISRGYQRVLSCLFQESLDLIGAPPSRYALIALSGLSREELFPSTKSTIAMIIEEPHQIQFFQRAAQLFQIKAAGLLLVDNRPMMVGTPAGLALRLLQSPNFSFLMGDEELARNYASSITTLLQRRRALFFWFWWRPREHQEQAISMLEIYLRQWEELRSLTTSAIARLNLENDLYRPLDKALQSLLLYFNRTGQTREGINELSFTEASRTALRQAYEAVSSIMLREQLSRDGSRAKLKDKVAIYKVVSSLYQSIAIFLERRALQEAHFSFIRGEKQAIHLAAERGETEQIRDLIAHGETIDSTDWKGRTPLHLAVIHNRVETVRSLLELYGEWIPLTELDGATPLHLAVSTGNLRMIDLILEHYSPQRILDVRDKRGETALHWAIKKEKLQVIKSLLDNCSPGVIINRQDQEGETALHWTIRGGYIDSARVLMERGADCLIPNRRGKTALDIALQREDEAMARTILFGKETLSTTPPFAPPQGKSHETITKEALSYATQHGDRQGQIVSLEKFALLSLERQDYLSAAHFLNGALALMEDDFPFSSQILINQLERIEQRFISEKIDASRSLSYQGRISEHRRRLQGIRSSVENFFKNDLSTQQMLRCLSEDYESILTDPLRPDLGLPAIKEILTLLTEGYKSILRELLDECITVLGPPPARFTMVGLGSMSRDELCPYSDLEFCFLIQEDLEDEEEIKNYLRSITRLMMLKIVNFGETKYEIPLATSIKQSFTPSGFSMDSSLSPLGINKLFGEPLVELIGTPSQLAQIQVEGQENEALIILVNAMRSVCGIAGDEELVGLYEDRVNDILNRNAAVPTTLGKWSPQVGIADRSIVSSSSSPTPQLLRQKRALELMHGAIIEFQPLLDQDKINERTFGIKKELYRLPQMVINGLALYHGVRTSSTFEQIHQLHNRKIISKSGSEKLEIFLILTLLLRTLSHLFYKNEKEYLHYQKKEPLDSKENLLLIAPGSPIIVICYQILIPFYKITKRFLAGDEKTFTESPFYDDSIAVPSYKTKNKSQPAKTRESIENALALNPDSSFYNNALGIVLSDLGAHEAIQQFKKTIQLLRRKHQNQSHPSIAGNLMNLGNAYSYQGKYQKAISNCDAAFKMFGEIYIDQPHPDLVNSLLSLGDVRNRSDDYAQAFNDFFKALELSKQLPSSCSRIWEARSLGSLGKACERKGAYLQAIDWYRQSQTIYQEIHNHQPHLDLVIILSQLGSAHFELGKYKQADDYYCEALKIGESVHGGEPHPSMAHILTGLGMVCDDLKEYDKALTYHQRSLEMERRIYNQQPHFNIAISLKNIGLAHKNLGHLDLAIACYLEASDILEGIYKGRPHPSIAIVLHSLGNVYCDQGRYNKARACYERSLAIDMEFHHNQLHSDMAFGLMGLGNAFFGLGSYKQAIKAYQQSLQLFTLKKDLPNIQKAKGNLEEAIQKSQASSPGCSSSELPPLPSSQPKEDQKSPGHARQLIASAETLRRSGDDDAAIPLYYEAYQIFRGHLGPDHPDTLEASAALTEMRSKSQTSMSSSQAASSSQ